MARRKPHDPAAATKAALERRAQEAEIARLTLMGATITTDHVGRLVSARLSNVYNLFLQRGTINANQYDAAYRLAETWAVWKGLDGKPEGRGEFVDGGAGCPEIVTDRMIFSGKVINGDGKRIVGVLEQLDAPSRKVTEAFMVATVEEDRAMSWRGIMERLGVQPGQITIKGKREDRQVVAFVAALEALRAVYQDPHTQHRVAA